MHDGRVIATKLFEFLRTFRNETSWNRSAPILFRRLYNSSFRVKSNT